MKTFFSSKFPSQLSPMTTESPVIKLSLSHKGETAPQKVIVSLNTNPENQNNDITNALNKLWTKFLIYFHYEDTFPVPQKHIQDKSMHDEIKSINSFEEVFNTYSLYEELDFRMH